MGPSLRTRPGTGSGTWQQPGGGAPRRRPGAAAHSLLVGRVAGVPLEVHWTFLLLLAWVAFADARGGLGAVLTGLAWVVALFAFVVLHELGHSVVARRRGGIVLGILLLPFGGISRMARIPERPADETAIAIAGPAVSLGLGALLLAIAAFVGAPVWPPALGGGGAAASWWANLGWLNLFLAALNLLPALPMDGGRVLRATLARRLPRVSATRIAASVARVLAVALVIAGVAWDVWLVLIGIFVFIGARSEEAHARADAHVPPSGVAAPGRGPWGPPPTWPPPTWPAPSARTVPPFEERSGTAETGATTERDEQGTPASPGSRDRSRRAGG